ncbi:MAG: type pilus assembly protein PilB [Solirubrobacteraceae bacterium]|jgi:type IV pilus assembly protein PilB|nr:type pilus assembly protein PilB [Solirubrobacteraceae bacterium]
MASDRSTRKSAARAHPGRLLGDVLVSLGYCDRDTVEDIVSQARAEGRPMGHLLREQGLIDADRLAIALAERFGLEYASLETLVPDLAAMHLVSPSALRRLEAVPLAFRDEETLIVAMAQPSNSLALDGLAMLTDLRVEPVVVTPEDLDVLLGRLAAHELVVDHATPLGTPSALAAVARPSAGFLRSVICRALEQGASDVRFEPDGDELQVRYRLDGVMAEAARIAAADAGAVIARIKTLSDLDADERHLPQNGRMTLMLDDRRIDIRVTTVPGIDGESAVLHLVDRRRRPPTLAELGMDEADRARLEQALSRSHGAILATGPTGSGRCTLLHAAAAFVNSPAKTMVTISEAVRYHLPGAQQVQVAANADLSFTTGLRAIVQADPDVILVGELREPESARIAIDAALTDQLVLSTLHVDDAPSAAARLIDMGVEPYAVAAGLQCVIAERLARRLCTHCRVPVAAEAGTFEAGGCEHCRDTGYHGRTGLFEVMTVSEEIRALIVERAPVAEIRRTAIEQGMRTLAEHGLQKVRAGETTYDELARVTA